MLAQQLTSPVPSLRAARAGAPEWIDRVVSKALSKAPADRFATAAGLAAALVAPRATEAVAALPADKSIAVLPFANLSADPDNEFFADGMTDELINALAKVPGLRVVGPDLSLRVQGQADRHAVDRRPAQRPGGR